MSDFATKLYSLPAILIGLTFHEYCHAAAAYALGDPTARRQGRLTLNPLKHIDPIGFIFLLFAGFGWAKPVSFDQRYLLHPKRDEALIAAAGPVSNLLLAILSAGLLGLWMGHVGYDPDNLGAVATMLMYLVFINLGLFVFNLLPLPPLDGFHVFLSFIDIKRSTEELLYRYGSWALFAVIIAESILKIDILPIGKLVYAMAGVLFRVFGMMG